MTDLDAGPEQARGRSTTFVVMLAIVFLTVLGASVGFILAKSNKSGADNAGGTPTFDTEATPSPSRAGGSGGTPGPYPSHGLQACPKQLEDQTGLKLTLIRAIRTDRSEAWICKAPSGDLFYQGHQRGKPFEKALSDFSICLQDVRMEGDVYVATNHGNDGTVTKYYVARDYLRITQNGNDKSNETGTDHWGQ